MKAIIFHGTNGFPGENWFPWLKGELEKKGWSVFVPKFPTPQNQNLDSWLDVFGEYENYVGDDTVLVGHSLGVAFILNVLERFNLQVKAAFLVAGFVGKLNISKFDKKNKTFVEKEFNWKRIRENCKKFYILHSDNDPYVPIEKAQVLASNLLIEPIIVRNAGHFNREAGYTSFPLLLEKILKV